MKRFYTILITFFLLATATKAQIQDVTLQTVIPAVKQPIYITHCGDSRMFVVSKAGHIFVYDSNYAFIDTFLNVTSIITASSSEQGLLGLAFHPDYATNGYFYIFYTASGGGDNTLARFSANGVNPNNADFSSGVVMFSQDDFAANHNGGCLQFGHDGYLYIAMGDGGSAGDPNENGQDLGIKLAKLLRIDVNVATAPYYTSPADNPFVNTPGAQPEIWAYGLRNPWRFSVDRLTGDVWIGDVGQNQYEEIDFQPAGVGGQNYGWKCYEALHFYSAAGPCAGIDLSTLTMPILEYSHSATSGCSVTGGYVYRGDKLCTLYGKYIFADYCNGKVQYLDTTGGTLSMVELYDLSNYVASFGEDKDGEIYVCSYPTNGSGNAAIYKIVPDIAAPVLGPVSDVCPGSSTSLVAAPTGGTYMGAGVDSTSGLFDPTMSTVNYGLQTVVYTIVGDVCGNTASDTVSFQYLSPVQVTATVANPAAPGIICVNLPYVLDASISGGTFTTSSGTITGNQLTVSTEGNVVISYAFIDSNDCAQVALDTLTAEICSNVETEDLLQSNIYPNPASENVRIELNVAAENVTAELFDMSGKAVRSFVILKGNMSHNLEVGDLSDGIYMLRLTNPTGVSNLKLVKTTE